MVYCKDCNSQYHPTALHVNNSTVKSTVSQQHQPSAPVNNSYSVKSPTVSSNYGGKEYRRIDNRCTRICGEFSGKSCAKIILANVYLQHKPETNIRLYVMLDDQSNITLSSSRMFDLFGINGQETEYILTSCSGKIRTVGRKVNNLIVSTESSKATWACACNTRLGLPNDEIEILSSGS